MKDWIWMPHPGHFIGAFYCRFHLNTYVNGYIVSTVGEYFPDAPVREILAEGRGVKLEGQGDDRKYDYMKKRGYEDIGWGRKYETMVFKAEKAKGSSCCPYLMIIGRELDMGGYNDPVEAYKGHLEMCKRWAKAKS